MKKITFIIFVILQLWGFNSDAQDHSFSQFLGAPLYLNPALTGVTKGAVRMNFIYRNQWPGIPGAFEYFNASIDSRVDFVNGGLGLMFNRSSEGQGYLTRNSLFATYSNIFTLAKGRNNINLILGTGFGFANRSLDFNKLKFGDQFEQWRQNIQGISSASSVAINQSIFYPDVQGGFALQFNNLMFGLGIQHLTEPNESFTSVNSFVPKRITFHSGLNFQIGNTYRNPKDPILLQPTFLYIAQGNFSTMSFGVTMKRNFWNTGVYYRQSKGFADNDALILTIGFDTFRAKYNKREAAKRINEDQLKVGFSYDATVSSLGYDQTFGSVETAVTYTGPVNPWWDNVFYRGQPNLYGGMRKSNSGAFGGFFRRVFGGSKFPSSSTRCYDFMW